MTKNEVVGATTEVGITSLAVTSEYSTAPSTKVDNNDPDNDVSLGEFLARPRYIGVTTWAAADVFETELNSTSVLSTLLSNTDLQLKLRGFSAMKFDLHVRLQCAGSPFFLGGLAVGWRPTGGGSTNNLAISDVPSLHPAQLLTMPAHALIDPSKRDNIDLVLPFVHINGRYDLYIPQPYDYLTMTVLNKIATTSTEVATCTVTMHAWMTNVTLMGPTYQSEMNGSVSRVKSSGARIMRGFASTFARTAADAALTAAGLGAPQLAPHSVTYNNNAPIYTSNGAHPASTLACHALVETPVDPIANVEETNIRHLCSREGWVGSISWAPNTTPLNLAHYGVHPIHLVASKTVGTVTTDTAYLYTPLGYCASAFRLWRGTIRFRIEVRGNKFCTGTLRIRHAPREYSVPGFKLEISDTVSTFLDITTGSEAVLDCPFVAMRPWLEVGTDYTKSYTTSNGSVIIDYIEPLKSGGPAGPNVEINVYVSCPDIEFSAPAEGPVFAGLNYNVSSTPTGNPTYQTFANDQYYDVRDMIKLPRLQWGYQASTAIGVSWSSITLPDAPLCWPLKPLLAGDYYYANNPLKHFSGLFLCRTGGLRYTVTTGVQGSTTYSADGLVGPRYHACKRLTGTSTTNTTGAFTSGGGAASAWSATTYAAGSLAVCPTGSSIVVYDSPDTSNNEWVLARGVATSLGAWWDTMVPMIKHTVFCSGDEPATVGVSVALSGADDANLSYFICVPFVRCMTLDT